MQQGSSLAPINTHGAIVSHERKVIVSTAIAAAEAMCRGIGSIVQLGLNESHMSPDDMECIFTLVNELTHKLQAAQSEINA